MSFNTLATIVRDAASMLRTPKEWTPNQIERRAFDMDSIGRMIEQDSSSGIREFDYAFRMHRAINRNIGFWLSGDLTGEETYKAFRALAEAHRSSETARADLADALKLTFENLYFDEETDEPTVAEPLCSILGAVLDCYDWWSLADIMLSEEDSYTSD
jgi:hypothetical protein